MGLLTNANSRLAQSRNMITIKSTVSFQGPCLVGIIQMGLAIVRDIITVGPHHDSRVVVLWVGRPLVGDIRLLRVPYGHMAVMLEGGGAGPQGGYTSGSGLKRGVYL